MSEEEPDRATFDYLLKKDIPSLVDAVCKYVMTEKPADPLHAIADFLQARHGHFQGGVAVAGRNVGGGWLSVIDGHGHTKCTIEKLPFDPTKSNMQLIASAPKESAVYIAMPNPDSETDFEIRRYNYLDGSLTNTIAVQKHVTAINVERVRGLLYVMFENGGGAVYQSSGSFIRDLAIHSVLAVHIRDQDLFVLTPKSIERRNLEDCSLETVVHLPDSIAKPHSFVLGSAYVYCGSANADGTANYVGAFDLSGHHTQFPSQGGSVLAHDRSRGGIWQTLQSQPQAQAVHPLTFINDKGAKIISSDLPKGKSVNLVVDHGSCLLWHFRVTDEGYSRLGLWDPFRTKYQYEITLPDIDSPCVHMVSI